MEEQVKKGRGWLARLRESSGNPYRLVVMDPESHREVGDYQLTPKNVYIAVTTLLLLLLVAIFLLVAYTPLRNYIPGYGDRATLDEMRAVQREIRTLQDTMELQQRYIATVTKRLRGEVVTEKDVEAGTQNLTDEEMEPVSLSADEVALRREMELERVGNGSRSGNGAPVPGSRDVPLEQLYFVSPITGEVSAGFNPGDRHYGVDILAPLNTPVKAVLDGVVVVSEYTTEHGNTVVIQHDNNVVTSYKHNDRLLKEVGAVVKAGEAVAIIGNTGTKSTGPHLHFEIWHNGRAVDPVAVVSF
ncbi:MAG: M23 family metallopeptidase [Saprospiraceae bacterium]